MFQLHHSLVRRRVALLLSIFSLTFVHTAILSAQDGALDLTFNTTGIVTTGFGGVGAEASGVALQSDGKIVVAGSVFNGSTNDFGVACYTSVGVLDATFDSDGKVVTSIGVGDDVAACVAIQSDGKILAAGYSSNGSQTYFAIVRYTSSGVLDSTFSGDGIDTLTIGSSYDVATCIAIQSDGKIVVGGFTNNGTNRDFAVIRYTNAGVLDNTFGANGIVTTSVSSSDDELYGIVIQSDGKIVAGGYSWNGTYTDFTVIRYSSNGILDNTFGGGDGIVTADFGNISRIRGIALQADEKIVAVGSAFTSTYDFGAARFTSTGVLDSTFDGDGKVTTPIGGGGDLAQAVAIQSDGKIVVAGYSFGVTSDFAVVRYTSTGALDNTFDGDGKTTTVINSTEDAAMAVAIQTDGKIVTVGYIPSGGNRQFAVIRYTGSSSPLPVELVSFTASAKLLSVELQWNTATEVNNYGFEIERTVISDQSSVISWSKAGFVEGNGTTNASKEYSYNDRNVGTGKYLYRLKQVDRDGKFSYSQSVEVEVGNLPKVFTLEQNYPNPFNPSTVISYQLPANSQVTLKVYDAIGREVATLVNEVKEAGNYSVTFDASRFSSGIYFARLQSGDKVQLKKMLLIK